MAVMLTQPFNKGFAITKSDTVDFPFVDGMGRNPDAIHCTAAGNVVIVWESGTTSTVGVVAGQVLYDKAKRVNSTDTTATGLVAMYAV